ncbi:Flagella synthesis protein FlgN [Enterobacter sp. DC4]|uniref:flagella synthesis protein FlgN n=1 Tax=Enterobacter sp. DC4 TaxID=1395580 RepID=UPI0003ED074E|nr:flagellar export chaperone FlgN [Enterobacter sp. DC4]EWG67279.1 Flagella synthesis protein FlgN [Enterobacter sp. DC4]
MEALSAVLTQLQTLMDELADTLTEEVSQLSQARVNPVSLQVISDNKSRLLSSIDFYDEKRKEEEKRCQTQAPYPHECPLTGQWEHIVQVVKRSSQLNQKSFQLLNLHLQRVNEFKVLMDKASGTQTLYGEGGNNNGTFTGKAMSISV